LLPARNRRDFDDISEDVRRKLEFIWLEQADEAIAAALTDHRATAAVPNLAGQQSANGGDPETAVRRPPLAAQAAGKRDSIKN
jgi:hypothetical protein